MLMVLLMSKAFMRQMIDAILPEGSIWNPKDGGDFDNLLNGIAENWNTVDEFLTGLASIRDPHFTTFLAELEQEYGVLTNPNLTEVQRRSQLSPIVYSQSKNGSIDSLQQALDDAGFNVQVHSNCPAVDPAIFLDQDFQMVAGGGNAYAGRVDAFAGQVGGELLVNGDIFETQRIYTSVAGTMYAGTAGAGEYDDLERTKVEYPIPIDPAAWPLVFFVGGDAIRDGSGFLTDIELGEIPSEQESAFKRIILKYKPIHTWAGLIIAYI